MPRAAPRCPLAGAKMLKGRPVRTLLRLRVAHQRGPPAKGQRYRHRPGHRSCRPIEGAQGHAERNTVAWSLAPPAQCWKSTYGGIPGHGSILRYASSYLQHEAAQSQETTHDLRPVTCLKVPTIIVAHRPVRSVSVAGTRPRRARRGARSKTTYYARVCEGRRTTRRDCRRDDGRRRGASSTKARRPARAGSRPRP